MTTTVATGLPGGCGSDPLATSTRQKLEAAATTLSNTPPGVLAQPFVPLVDPCVRQKAFTWQNGTRVGASFLGFLAGPGHGALAVYTTAALEVTISAAECQ